MLRSTGRRGGGRRERERERELLFERETEHLWLRQLMHGIGRDPFAREFIRKVRAQRKVTGDGPNRKQDHISILFKCIPVLF